MMCHACCVANVMMLIAVEAVIADGNQLEIFIFCRVVILNHILCQLTYYRIN